jgi:hypothetical protein
VRLSATAHLTIADKEAMCETYWKDVRGESIHVNHGINTRVGKYIHASIMVSISVDMIHSNRVHAQFLHQSSISFALSGINQGIG